MPWQREPGGRDVHLMPSQDGVGILLGPKVIEGGRCVLFGLAWPDPAHLDGVNQFGDLQKGGNQKTKLPSPSVLPF